MNKDKILLETQSAHFPFYIPHLKLIKTLNATQKFVEIDHCCGRVYQADKKIMRHQLEYHVAASIFLLISQDVVRS